MKEIEVFEEQNEVGGVILAAIVCSTGCTGLCAGTAGLGSFVGLGVAEAGGIAVPLP